MDLVAGAASSRRRRAAAQEGQARPRQGAARGRRRRRRGPRRCGVGAVAAADPGPGHGRQAARAHVHVQPDRVPPVADGDHQPRAEREESRRHPGVHRHQPPLAVHAALLRRLRVGEGRRHAEDQQAVQLAEADRPGYGPAAPEAGLGHQQGARRLRGRDHQPERQLHRLQHGRHAHPGQGRHHPRGRLVAQGRQEPDVPLPATCAASTSSSRAKRSRRSRRRSWATRATGEPSRRSTGSTTPCASARARAS